MNARRNLTKERKTAVAIASVNLDKMMMDGRTGLKAGTIRAACLQRGVSVEDDGTTAILSAPRDRLQLVVELLYFSRTAHKIVG